MIDLSNNRIYFAVRHPKLLEKLRKDPARGEGTDKYGFADVFEIIGENLHYNE